MDGIILLPLASASVGTFTARKNLLAKWEQIPSCKSLNLSAALSNYPDPLWYIDMANVYYNLKSP